MVTRLSQLFVRTLREDPADAEVRSHRLLVRAGYIRRQAPGIFAWLPLGLRVKTKLEQIVREEMAAAGAQEVHFPAMMPREPYEVTGRWEEYGDALLRLKDRHGADYLLAPTHEEAFTLLVKDLFNSYKDLPLSIFQIQDKYRDEARPRAGLLRGREFTMKDAYSFDVDDAGLDASYDAQRAAYERIFQRLGVEYAIVKADAGAMGGSRSEEFLHPTAVGEDTFVRSEGGYAANVEAFTTSAPEPVPFDGLAEPRLLPEADTPTIDTLVDHLNATSPRGDGRAWQASDTLKNVVLALTWTELGDGKDAEPIRRTKLVVVGIPGDRAVDMKRAEVAFAGFDVEMAGEEQLNKTKALFGPELVPGYIGPVGSNHASGREGQQLGLDDRVVEENAEARIEYLLDPRVVDGTSWATGANEKGRHVAHLVAGRDFVADGIAEIAEVRDGDPAPDGSGPVTRARGMEIGHIFQLGRKYADALGLKVLNENGKLVTVTMGSYGIGVTRVLALIAELFSDDKGLIWPESIATDDIHVVATGKGGEPYELAESVTGQLEAAGFDVLYDDRPKVSPGVKFGDAELLGVPQLLVVGRGAADGDVELWDRRSGERETLPAAAAVARLAAR